MIHAFVQLVLLISFALLSWEPTSVAAENESRPLNVLFVTSDDLGLELSCYGDKVIQTPNLDALAARSTLFEVAYVTQASCSPSRSSIFTGMYPHATGQYGLMSRPETSSGFALHPLLRDRTIPNLLKKAGYRTGIIGKLHVAPESSFAFDERPRADTRRVRAVAAAAKEFLSRDDATPFFLMVNYSDPHASRTDQNPTGWYFQAQVDGIPAEPLAAGDAPAWPFQGIDDPEQLERIANYYNCVRRLDEGVGMLLDALQASGHADDTLVIFCGDHGPPFARGKTTCYEAGTRVPFIVRWPGVSRAARSQAMVSTVDILPTILDAAGQPIPDDLHGKSLRPVLADPDAPWRQYLAAEFHFHGGRPFFPRRAIRNDRYHLIHNLLAAQNRPSTGIDGDQAMRLSQTGRYDGTSTRRTFQIFANPPEFELYDLQADPAELKNLAGRSDFANIEADLKEALMTWRRATDDPLLDAANLDALNDRARR